MHLATYDNRDLVEKSCRRLIQNLLSSDNGDEEVFILLREISEMTTGHNDLERHFRHLAAK